MTADRYGSDIAADTWADVGVDHVVLNPGASISGIHDSLARDGRFQVFLALHENVALAIADGFARAAGRPAGVVLHNLVGLQSGAVGVFNAWANQVPVCIMGGGGPMDWQARRPWIDWVHSGKPQALAVRDSLKWHDQPASHAAIASSVRRGHLLATQPPCGPTYVALDVSLQESVTEFAESGRRRPAENRAEFAATEATVQEIADALRTAKLPVLVADLLGRSAEATDTLIELAEGLPAALVDLGGSPNVPSRHWADCSFARSEVLGAADVIVLLDARDPVFALGQADHRGEPPRPLSRPDARVFDVSLRSLLSGNLVDYAAPEPDGVVVVAAGAATVLRQLRQALHDYFGERPEARGQIERLARAAHPIGGRWDEMPSPAASLDLRSVSAVTWQHIRGTEFTVANGDLRGWLRAYWDLDTKNRYLGRNVGAGLGYGVGASIGAALAGHVRRPNEIIVNFQNDGDLLYTPSGLWTAARYDLPILTVVVNNRMYGQDKRHAERLMELRGRATTDLPEGVLLDRPAISYAQLAASQGMRGWGPAATVGELDQHIHDAVEHIRSTGRPALVDACVTGSPQRLMSL